MWQAPENLWTYGNCTVIIIAKLHHKSPIQLFDEKKMIKISPQVQNVMNLQNLSVRFQNMVYKYFWKDFFKISKPIKVNT